jgi:archaemetzincin
VTTRKGYEVGLSETELQRIADLTRAVERLRPLEVPLGPPEPGEWLAVHFEPGQDLEQYLGSRPATARGPRRVLYVQPLGDFSPGQRRVVEVTASFLERFFALPVKVREGVSLDRVPAAAQRRHPEWGDHQVLTGWVLDELLAPSIPDDAAAVICLSCTDLWPGEGWNFVFGQADLRRRVAVWSIYRNGDPDRGGDGFRICLRRTLQTAAHELCHVFGLYHEVRFHCLMNGSNHREEADRRPLWLCPESLAKLCWATGQDPRDHSRRVLELLDGQGLDDDAALHRRTLGLLGG